jgi:hypothetical protein
LIYQLPSGKVIYLTVEQYLSLSDEDLDMLSHRGVGNYAKTPFQESAITPQKKKSKDAIEEDKSIDFIAESEEFFQETPSIPLEEGSDELPDIPDQSEED